MFWLILIQWLHVLCGIFWLGSTLFINVVLVPATMGLPREKTREIAGRIGAQSERVFTPVGITVVVLGFVRGTAFGPVRSLDILFSTAYGLTWLIALVLGLTLVGWGVLVTGPSARGLNDDISDDVYAARLARVKLYTLLELVWFAAIFTCMILMRFGL